MLALSTILTLLLGFAWNVPAMPTTVEVYAKGYVPRRDLVVRGAFTKSGLRTRSNNKPLPPVPFDPQLLLLATFATLNTYLRTEVTLTGNTNTQSVSINQTPVRQVLAAIADQSQAGTPTGDDINQYTIVPSLGLEMHMNAIVGLGLSTWADVVNRAGGLPALQQSIQNAVSGALSRNAATGDYEITVPVPTPAGTHFEETLVMIYVKWTAIQPRSSSP